MSGGVLRRIGWLRKIRVGSAGIARLLLLAFALQLAVPLSDLGGVAALAGEAALRADLQASLCHDGKNTPSSEQAPASSSEVKHCVFCLPMAGSPASIRPAFQTPVPSSIAAITIWAADDQIPLTARPAFARSRAPPSSPRTV
jgi:hypothetical protein